MQANPDIEIYIKTKDINKIRSSLQALFKQDVEFTSQPPFECAQINNIPIKVYLNVKSGFSSIWFDSPDSPWDNDLHCAMAIQQQSGLICRCVKASWVENEQEDPDLWLEINNQGQHELLWR